MEVQFCTEKLTRASRECLLCSARTRAAWHLTPPFASRMLLRSFPEALLRPPQLSFFLPFFFQANFMPSDSSRSSMRISSMTLHSIAIADPPLRSSYGLHAPYALRTVVELTTDDGLTGIAETYGGDAPRAALEAARDRVVGMDPFRLAGLYQSLNQHVATTGDRSQTYLVPGENPADQHARTFAAIEFACLDIIGKAVGKPVCDVIGGRVRDEVAFSAYLFYKHAGGGGLGQDCREDEYGEVLTPEAMVRETRQMIAQYGFREIKLKGGVLDPEAEV